MTKDDYLVRERIETALHALLGVRLATSTRDDNIWKTAHDAYAALQTELLELEGGNA